MWSTYGLALVLVIGLMTLVWAISLLKRDAGIIDVFWGLGFVVVAELELEAAVPGRQQPQPHLGATVEGHAEVVGVEGVEPRLLRGGEVELHPTVGNLDHHAEPEGGLGGGDPALAGGGVGHGRPV